MTYKESSWNLSQLLNGKDIDALLMEWKQSVDAVEAQKDNFHTKMSEEEFASFIDLVKNEVELSTIIGEYAFLRSSEDTNDAEASAFLAKVSQLSASYSQRLLFFEMTFVHFEAKDIERLIAAYPNAQYYLRELVKSKKYLLSDKEESLCISKDSNGTGSLLQIYSMLQSRKTYPIDGKEYSRNELSVLTHSPDPVLREKAYKVMQEVTAKDKSILGEMYRAVVSDWNDMVQRRGYSSSINVRNIDNDIPDEAVDVLLSVAKKNESLWHRFFTYKAKKIGKEKLSRYDIYAPITDEKKEHISYEDSADRVLTAFKEFDEEFYSITKSLFDKEHVHSQNKKGKREGAFCYSGSPEHDPFVLLSHTGDMSSVRTLAHEMGHAIHAVYSKEQSIFEFHAAIPVCETASIFCEQLLVASLMKAFPEKKESLIANILTDSYASIGRQIEITRCEIDAHKIVTEHGSTDDICKKYLSNLREHFGPVEVDEGFQYEWLSWPHIFESPFYCYGYGFGNLLALSCYEAYQEQGDSFKDKLKAMLKSGGSISPKEQLEILGFDIASEAFWQKGFDYLEKLLDELEGIKE